MTKKEKQKVFEPLARDFETSSIKKYFRDMVAEIPDYVFTMPASISGKYHNTTQCQTYGQIYHIYMFASILNHRLSLIMNKQLFPTPEERDCMRCLPVFHDAIKCGWNGSNRIVRNHPILAAKWVMETKVTHDIPHKYKLMIANMCAAHMGEWNKDRSGKIIAPEPRNNRELCIHECDVLSSRADLDYIVPEELKNLLAENVKITAQDASENVIPFGIYKGMTVSEAFKINPAFILFAKKYKLMDL
jgi:hypothetical protein